MDLKNLKKKKIVVLKGGPSFEREISLMTARNVEKALKKLSLNYKGLEIKGNWLKKLLKMKPDICFLALHGKPGEDGSIQAILEALKIPYTGSGPLASFLSLNKKYSKIIFEKEKIPTPKWLSFKKEIKELPQGWKFPVVVKPLDCGSTLGITIVKDRKKLKKAIEKAFSYSEEVILEEYIKGKEISVGILENKPLPPIEIVPLVNSFYSFKAKYQDGGSKHILPARVPKKILKKVKELALKAHLSLGCKCFSRIDMRIRNEKDIYVLEVNSIPGMTKTSLLPEAAKATGIDFEEMVVKILKDAFK